MLTTEERIVVGLINRAITGTDYQIEEAFDSQRLLEICRSGSLVPLVFRGMKGLEGIPKDLYNTFLFISFQSAAHSKAQEKRYQQISSAFEEKKIDYMPLKGIELKNRYPNSDMRTMGDIDILIRTEQYDQIRECMTELGFQEILESDHELVWDSGEVHVELHKRLIPSYNTDFYAYFGEGWRLAEQAEGCHRWRMNREDTFIYLFTHFAKHYRDGGIGIRQLTDLWVYLRTEPEMDESYLRVNLEKLHLTEFYINIRRTLAALFEEAKPDETTELIADHLFASGTFGTQEGKDAAAALRIRSKEATPEAAKAHQWIAMIFPAAVNLESRYPVLKKQKWLLPLFWIIRWFDVLIHSPAKIKSVSKRIDMLSDGTADQYQDSLKAVGLQYYYGKEL